MEIRPATREDVPAIVALLADDEHGATREDPSPDLDRGYLVAFEAIDGDPNHELIVATDEDGTVIGTFQLGFLPGISHRGAWRAQIEAVRIARDRRGSGLGHELMTWAIERARERECRMVQLTSNATRDRAHRFYESLGFEATHHGMKLILGPAEV